MPNRDDWLPPALKLYEQDVFPPVISGHPWLPLAILEALGRGLPDVLP